MNAVETSFQEAVSAARKNGGACFATDEGGLHTFVSRHAPAEYAEYQRALVVHPGIDCDDVAVLADQMCFPRIESGTHCEIPDEMRAGCHACLFQRDGWFGRSGKRLAHPLTMRPMGVLSGLWIDHYRASGIRGWRSR